MRQKFSGAVLVGLILVILLGSFILLKVISTGFRDASKSSNKSFSPATEDIFRSPSSLNDSSEFYKELLEEKLRNWSYLDMLALLRIHGYSEELLNQISPEDLKIAVKYILLTETFGERKVSDSGSMEIFQSTRVSPEKIQQRLDDIRLYEVKPFIREYSINGNNEIAKLEKEAVLKKQWEIIHQAMLKDAVEQLPKGEFFHTVPKTLTADVPVLIEAGIAEKVTKQFLRDLQIKGIPETKKGVPYAPLGTEVKLDVDKDFFRVRDIKTGVKPIIPGLSESWMWELIPTRRGKSTVTILVVVHLDVPGTKGFKKEKVVFKEEKEVQINLGYSVSKFTGTYWKEISTLVFGSGSLAWAISWLMNRKKDKPDDSDDQDTSPFGLAGFLNQASNKKTK